MVAVSEILHKIFFFSGERRHLARITPQAERPFDTPYVLESESEVAEL
jgi:hypothetical protein